MEHKYPILTRNEAAQKAYVTPAAISAALERGELTALRKRDLDPKNHRINGVYIYDDGYFKAYCEKVQFENYKNSGRIKFD